MTAQGGSERPAGDPGAGDTIVDSPGGAVLAHWELQKGPPKKRPWKVLKAPFPDTMPIPPQGSGGCTRWDKRDMGSYWAQSSTGAAHLPLACTWALHPSRLGWDQVRRGLSNGTAPNPFTTY